MNADCEKSVAGATRKARENLRGVGF